MSRFWIPLIANVYLSTFRTNGNISTTLSLMTPSTVIFSIFPSFLFLNSSFLASVLNISLSDIDRSSPLILMTPLMLGITMFILVSICAVHAISQFSRPLNDFSRGMSVSTEGMRSMTFSAVMSMRLRLNPVLRSFLVFVE